MDAEKSVLPEVTDMDVDTTNAQNPVLCDTSDMDTDVNDVNDEFPDNARSRTRDR